MAGQGERRAIEIPLRAGCVYERSPVPQEGRRNFIDADRHTTSLGAGVVLNRPLEELPGSLRIDLHGQLSVLPDVAVENDNPADFVGDYRADGTMLNLGRR
ncbi:hypothetical protein [Sorangium sp. So ce145]|uniref:hypothetical protein n=1 Tax=Sorangium sp. So ce145 TaxID=3133285 RepID=UPI003F619586